MATTNDTIWELEFDGHHHKQIELRAQHIRSADANQRPEKDARDDNRQ
jgi:hypothetical protein